MACGFYFTDVVCGFSPGQMLVEKFCHLRIMARVGWACLCVGLCREGPYWLAIHFVGGF